MSMTQIALTSPELAEIITDSKVGKWDFHTALFGAVIDGKRVFGPIMRRRVAGGYEYRRMREDESADYVSRESW